MKKTIVALLLTFILALPTFGAYAEESLPFATDIDLSEPVVINFQVFGDAPAGEPAVLAKINEILSAKINTTLNWQRVSWTDWSTVYNLMLATGEDMDLITSSASWLGLWENADKGAFLDISELLPKYAPNIYANTTADAWNMCKYKGQIICVPGNHYAQYSNHGMMYRGDWLKEFGMDEIKTIDGLEAYWAKVVEVYGPQGVVPWNTKGGVGDLQLFSMYEAAYAQHLDINGLSIGQFPSIQGVSLDDPYTLCQPLTEDWFVDYAKLMKKWADLGFWPTDVMNSANDSRALLRAGLSASDQHHVATYTSLVTEIEKPENQPGADLKIFLWSDLSGYIVKESFLQDVVAVSAKSKHPDRALMVLDLLKEDEELNTLLNYGIEGVQYVINADGKRENPASFDTAKDTYWSDAWGVREDKYLRKLPHVDDWAGKADMFANRLDPISVSNPYANFVFDSSAVTAELTAVTEAVNRYSPAIHFGKVEDPEEAVKELRTALEQAGIQKLFDEVQRQMTAYKESLGL